MSNGRVPRARLAHAGGWPPAGGRLPVVLCLLLCSPGAVSAHAILVASAPPHEAVLDEPPLQATLRFNARLETAVTHVELSGTQGTATRLKAGASSGNQLVVELPRLSPGVYTLRYKVLARDGHVTEGSIRFTIRGQ